MKREGREGLGLSGKEVRDGGVGSRIDEFRRLSRSGSLTIHFDSGRPVKSEVRYVESLSNPEERSKRLTPE